MRVVSIFIVMFLLLSCDEVNKIVNPADDYLVEKTLSASQTEQIIESGNEFKMIFPANSLAGNLDIKVKKESSYPNFSVTNTKLGNNIYKIKFKGESTFQSPALIAIKYDGSKIPNGKTASEVVKSYIYANGSWKLADFIIDESNKQLIISISSFLNPKINKDNPLLMESEGDIIIGDGYTTTDAGQNDELLEKFKYFICRLTLDDITVIRQSNNQEIPFQLSTLTSMTGFENGPGNIDSVFVKWEKNKFIVLRRISNPTFSIDLSISGEVDKTTWNVNNLIYNYSRFNKLSEFESSNLDVLIHFNKIKGRFSDVGGMGKYFMLEIDSKANDNPSNHDQDLNKIIKDISCSMSWSSNNIIVDLVTLKSINDLTKNRFSLDLRSLP